MKLSGKEFLNLVFARRNGASVAAVDRRISSPGQAASKAIRASILSEQCAIIARNGTTAFLGTMLVAIIAAGSLFGSDINSKAIIAWLALLVVTSCVRLHLLLRFEPNMAPVALKKWLRQSKFSAFTAGLAWGVTSLWLYMNPGSLVVLFVTVTVMGVTAAISALDGADRNVQSAFAGPALAPFAIYFVSTLDVYQGALALFLVLYFFILRQASNSIEATIAHNVSLNLKNEKLVHDLKSTVGQLSESRVELGIISDYSNAWESWFGNKGELLWVSPAVEQITGYTPDECREMKDYPLEIIHRDDRTKVAEGLNQAVLRGTDEEFVFRIVNKSGATGWCAVESRPAIDPQGKQRGFRASVRDITAQKKLEHKLQKLAATDSLTGAYNRRRAIETLEAEAYRSKRYDVPLTVAAFDLDHFKSINDSFGHAAGDECLKAFVDVILKTVRLTDTLARFGGEEFLLILPETTAEDAFLLCKRLRQKVENLTVSSENHQVSFTVSAGVAQLSSQEETVDALISRADKALYEAKRNGRNRIVLSGYPAVLPRQAA